MCVRVCVCVCVCKIDKRLQAEAICFTIVLAHFAFCRMKFMSVTVSQISCWQLLGICCSRYADSFARNLSHTHTHTHTHIEGLGIVFLIEGLSQFRYKIPKIVPTTHFKNVYNLCALKINFPSNIWVLGYISYLAFGQIYCKFTTHNLNKCQASDVSLHLSTL